MTNNITNIPKATLLTKEQLFGKKLITGLYMFKMRGVTSAITDYATALGGRYLPWKFNQITKENEEYAAGIGKYITKNIDTSGTIYGVSLFGSLTNFFCDRSDVGERIVFKWTEIKDYCSNITTAEDGILEAEYGLLPDNAVCQNLQEELNHALKNNTLEKLPLTYITNITETNQKLLKEQQEVYEYKGEWYARVKVKPQYEKDYIRLSNKQFYKIGNYVWIKIKPIKFWVDLIENIAVSEKIVIAGITPIKTSLKSLTLDNKKNKANITTYLERYFSIDIFKAQYLKEQIEKQNSKRKIKKPE